MGDISKLNVGGTLYDIKDAKARTDVSDLKEDLDEFKDGFHNLNLFGEAELLYEDGYAAIENGKISPRNPVENLNAYIIPVDGESIYTFTNCRFAFLVDADKETAIGDLLQYVTQVDSTGASYICFTFNYSTYPIENYQISQGTVLETGYVLPNWLDPLQEQADTLDNRMYGVEQLIGANLFYKAELIKENGYASIENGHIVYNNLANYNAYLIPVDGESIYNFTDCRFAFLVASDKYTAIGDMLQYVTAVDSTGASYICFSFNTSSYPVTSYKVVLQKSIVIKPKSASVSGSLSNGSFLYVDGVKNNLRKGERIVFSGNITSFSSLMIGLAQSTDISTPSYRFNYFVIDGSKVDYYTQSSSTPVSVLHGLTLANNLQIIWEMTATATLKLTITSNGVSYEHEFAGFVRKTYSLPFVLSNGTAMTDCKLSWTCKDINKNIWMFGDSYLGYGPERWTYYLHEYGYDNNTLLDGFAGQGGVNGRQSFNNLLTYSVPKIAVWCLGMNDDSDSSSAPSSAWVSGRDYFLTYCEQNNVTPVFATIPTVPTVNNEQKNAWVRSSGYRYIDFAKAVGANASGVWYSGMLSNDGVHPSEQGAKALFARALLDLPELMVDDLDY